MVYFCYHIRQGNNSLVFLPPGPHHLSILTLLQTISPLQCLQRKIHERRRSRLFNCLEVPFRQLFRFNVSIIHWI
jgi:hypothetical protein